MTRRYPPGYWQDPRQIPGPSERTPPFDDSGHWRNPAGTVPFPIPKDMPVGVWNGGDTMFSWSAGVDNVVRTALWGSPIFDLRPEQRAAMGQDTQQGNSIPIWKPSAITSGGGGKLWVQIGSMTQVLSLESMEIMYEERAHIQHADDVQVVTPFNDITDQYVDGSENLILAFSPPGSGYPVRFWQVRIRLDIYDTLAGDPTLKCQAAYY